MKISLLPIIWVLILILPSCLQQGEGAQPVPAEQGMTAREKTDTEEKSLEELLSEEAFTRINGKIARNQFLSSLLTDFGVEYPLIDSLIRQSRGGFDIRKIRVGNHYTAYLKGDSLPRLHYLIYESHPAEQVVFDLNPPVSVYTMARPVQHRVLEASGIIEVSLWQTLIDQELNPGLAMELSEIYAWTVDFFGLQKGDHFRVIYEESFVDSLSLGITRIFGACFNHMGEDIYAIQLEQDSVSGYFDQYGNSLRKAFLKAPLRFSRISSGFSYSRMHPILKYRRPHLGVDYAAPVGTPVVAIGDGRVISAAYQGDAGRMVKIRHNSVYTTAYLHLRSFAPGIRTGSYVRQGQVIGYVGSTGLSTGPHLDFRFYRNGQPVDPLRVEAPPVEPVSPENMDLFHNKRKIMVDLLAGISAP